MPENPKKKRAVIGEDGEFLEAFPVKEKRKQAPPRSRTYFWLLLCLCILLTVGVTLLVTIPLISVEQMPMPSIAPTEEAFAVQVTDPISSCEPIYTLDGDKISLIANKDGKRSLHIYALDYGIWCTLDMPILQHMAWNPDGSQLAFTGVPESGGNIQLFVMNADGSNLRQLTDSEDLNIDFAPEWSTHEDTIAYIQSKAGYMAVHIINSDGTGEKLIYETSKPMGSMSMRWGGGQNLILSHSADDASSEQVNQPEIFIHDIFSNSATRVTYNDAYDGNAVWLDYETSLPLIFLSDRDGKMGIYRMLIHEGDSQAVLLTPDDDFTDAPIVSPDQRQILYLTNRFEDLIIMSADGTNRRILATADSRIVDVQWSPDGQEVAYFLSTEGGGYNLNIVNINTWSQRLIDFPDELGQVWEFAWRPRAELLAIPPR